jgi:hypothetical protein
VFLEKEKKDETVIKPFLAGAKGTKRGENFNNRKSPQIGS